MVHVFPYFQELSRRLKCNVYKTCVKIWCLQVSCCKTKVAIHTPLLRFHRHIPLIFMINYACLCLLLVGVSNVWFRFKWWANSDYLLLSKTSSDVFKYDVYILYYFREEYLVQLKSGCHRQWHVLNHKLKYRQSSVTGVRFVSLNDRGGNP